MRIALRIVLLLALTLPAPLALLAQPQTLPGAGAQSGAEALKQDTDNHQPHALHEIDDAMVRLPLAAALGAALALRPRRKGTPKRAR